MFQENVVHNIMASDACKIKKIIDIRFTFILLKISRIDLCDLLWEVKDYDS